MGTASSVLLGILGVILTIIGIVLVIFGIIDLVTLSWISAIIKIVIGAVLIWVGADVIGWPPSSRGRV
jgi:threonine/homoserine/homoserine lactone efflux protein